MSLTPNPSYLDDWKDLKEYTHQKHEEAEKEKDQRDVTKDYVGEQISDYEVKDEAKELAEYEKIYQKIADISAGGGVDLSPYLKIEDASANFATKAEIPDVSGFITEDDLTDYAKKTDIPSVEGFVKEEDLADYAKKSDIPDVSGFITEDDLTDYAKKTDIPSVEGFVKEEDLEPYAKKTDIPDVSNFATISELNEGLAAKADKGDSYTKEESDAKYLTEHQSLDDYAKKSDIPEVPTKVSELENDVPFLVENDLNDYAKKTDIPDVSAFVTEETVDEKVDTAIAKVIADAPEDFDTLKEVADYIASDKTRAAEIEIAISNLQSQKADASTVYTKDEADAKFLTEHQDLSDYALKSDIPDISNLATKDELAEVEEKIPSVDAFATTEYVNSEIERVEEEIPDVTNLATKTEVEAVAAQIPSIEGLVTEEQLTEAVSDKATIAQVAAVDQKVDAIVVPDISNLATKAEVAEGDASVLNNVLGKIWNKSGNYFETKYSKDGKTAMVWNEYDGGGVLFDDTVNKIKTFCGVNDGGKGAGAINAQIYSKDTTNNTGSRLNVNPTGIFYSVGNSAIVSPETELAVKGDIPSVEGFATEEQLTAAVADKATIDQVAAVDQKVDAIVVPDISNLATKAEVAEGDASVLNNVLGKMWNKGGDCFYSQKKVGNKTALIFNESDGGGSKFDTSELASFVGVNDGGDISTGVHVQIYSKTKADNKGARLNVNPTGIFYGVGTSAVISPETEIAVKGDIPSVEGFATEEQLTAAVADKATISQVAAVDQKVDAIVVPDISNLATKVEVSDGDASVLNNVLSKMWNKGSDCFYSKKINANGNEALIFNEPDGGGVIYDDKQNKVKSFVGVNDGADPFTGILAQIYSKNTSTNEGARLNINPTGMYYGVGASTPIDAAHELAVKGDIPSVEGFATTDQLNTAIEGVNAALEQKTTFAYVNEAVEGLGETVNQSLLEKADVADVSAALETVETEIDMKADAETVPTKTEFEALKAKFEELKQLVFEYAPGSEEEAMADGEIADLSPSNKNINIETEMASIEVPATTTLYTVAAPLRNDSVVELTSDYSFSFDNMSEEPVNTTFKRESAVGETKVTGTTINLSGIFNDVTLENISIATRSGKDPATFANITIPETNEKELSITAQILDGATIKNDSDKQITITNRTDEGSEVILVCPNSTVVLSGGTYTTLTSETAENTLIVNQNVNIDELILKAGNVVVKDFDVSARINSVVDQSGGQYQVIPYEVEVSDASKFASTLTATSGIMEITDDLEGVRAAGFGIFANNRVKVNLNNHTVSGGNNNYVVYTRGSAVVEIWDGTINATGGGYAIWCQGGTVNLHNVHVIGCEHAIYLSNAAGEINVYGGRLEVNADSESTNYVVNYLDSVYASGCRAIHLYENTEVVDYDPSNAPSETGHPNLLLPGYHVESYAEGDHTIYKVVKDNE